MLRRDFDTSRDSPPESSIGDDRSATIRRSEPPRSPERSPPERLPTISHPRTVAIAVALPMRTTRSSLVGMLSSRANLRQAILLQEILGPPKSLRDDWEPRKIERS